MAAHAANLTVSPLFLKRVFLKIDLCVLFVARLTDSRQAACFCLPVRFVLLVNQGLEAK
jgi:hypothetical protein